MAVAERRKPRKEIDMPSDRKQINVRLDSEMEELLPLLVEAVRSKMRLTKVSASDVIRLGLLKVKDEFLPDHKPRKGGAL